MSLSLIYGVLINVDLFSVLGHACSSWTSGKVPASYNSTKVKMFDQEEIL